MSLALQYGLSRVPANRAIVILLFELVVAAVASYLPRGRAPAAAGLGRRLAHRAGEPRERLER